MMYKYICKLSNVARFAGKKLNHPYNTAEHSFRVASLSMLIVDDYNHKNPKNKINTEEVLRKALLHDLEESFINDIPTPAKKRNIKFMEAYDELSTEVMTNVIIGDNLVNKELYLKLWKEDKKGETGEIILLADKLEAWDTCLYELSLGNLTLKKAYIELGKWFVTQEGKRLFKKYPYAKEFFLNVRKIEKELKEFLQCKPSA